MTASALSRGERGRVVLIGMIAPLLLALVSWMLVTSWTDLPDSLPSHWSLSGAESFASPEAIILGWSFGCFFAAVLSACATLGALRSGDWTTVSRRVVAVGAGIAGAVCAGFVIPLYLARGATTERLVGMGAGPGLLALFVGFVVVSLLASTALPGRRRPPSASRT